MRRALLAVALAGAGAAAGAGVAAASGAFDDDPPVEVISVPAAAESAPARLVVEDGIARADARRLADAALADIPGSAISVERDDGLYQVELRGRDGRIHEVLLDDGFRVVGRDGDED